MGTDAGDWRLPEKSPAQEEDAFSLSPVVCILLSPLYIDTHWNVCALLGCSKPQEGRE